jgi:hypothetical protein
MYLASFPIPGERPYRTEILSYKNIQPGDKGPHILSLMCGERLLSYAGPGKLLMMRGLRQQSILHLHY